MSTITELIRSSYQIPIRKCWIKRRDTAGDYEASWVRIDEYQGTCLVKNWGSVSVEIDESEGRIAGFNVSNLSMQFENSKGLFNVETDSRSIWVGFLNRKLTKVKIEAGYTDTDDSEVGVGTIFEGVIDRVKISDSQIAQVKVLSYQNILKGYDISDLTMTGDKTVNAIIDLIMNQTKITNYIPFVAAVAAVNSTITTTENLDGSYWDVIKDMALISGSVPLLIADVWAFVDRTIGVSSVFDFVGKGSSNISDIYKISQYDDEGAERVVTKWLSSEGENATTIDATLRLKYPNDKTVDLSDVSTGIDRQNIVDELLDQWENPKPSINFDTRFFIAQINPLDKITLNVTGEIYPANAFRWDANPWVADESNPGDAMGDRKWGGVLGAITLASTDSWMVTKVQKNIDSWSTKIKAEKQV